MHFRGVQAGTTRGAIFAQTVARRPRRPDTSTARAEGSATFGGFELLQGKLEPTLRDGLFFVQKHPVENLIPRPRRKRSWFFQAIA